MSGSDSAKITRVRSRSANGIVYERRGSGSPVVLLHGWCLNRRLWMSEEAALAGQFDVVTPDLPGFGRSDDLAGPYTLDRYAADVQQLIEELELATPPVIAGFAFGGAVAMRLAADARVELAGLVLVGIPSGERLPAEALSRMMRRDWPEYCRRSARAICGRTQTDAMLAWLTDMFLATPLPVALETAKLLKAFEPRELAGASALPTLYVHGAQDDVSPLSIARECVALAENARLEIVEQCGHLVPIDQRAPFQEALQAFLAETTLTGAR